MEHNNKEDGHASFFRPLINAYIPLPIHGVTAIPGKIAGALMVADAIEDAIPLIHGPIGS
jgi:nitrogenase molybdenum-iron protein alpha/beta subunit